MKNIALFATVLLLSTTAYSSNLKIENVRVLNRTDIQDTPLSVMFDISWDNAWNNDKNHDAVWVFMKYNGQWGNHVKINPLGHEVVKNRTNGGDPGIMVPQDGVGFYLRVPDGYHGDVNYKVQIVIDTTGGKPAWNKLNKVSVHGVEMVYIPEGGFTLGSPDEAAIKRASLYKSDGAGEPGGLYQINSEDQITVGQESGNLYYWSEESIYQGDQAGPIPADFPKGYDEFYIMKYELQQGQYAAFLNDIPTNWTYVRSGIAGRDYHDKRGGIRLVDGQYVADNPFRPMNYVSFTDGLAYSDWAGLRPITELEYTKAARGPGEPIEAEFVWGTNSYANLERYVNSDKELAFNNGVNESDLNDDNRDVFGASYYWVMDLSGSLWEKVITVGNAVGRKFTGSNGDGQLDNFGNHNQSDWPTSDNEEGGFGYRGGGYYNEGTTYSDFNPHSPIGYRYYGAWSGGPRYIAYGYRAGRGIK